MSVIDINDDTPQICLSASATADCLSLLRKAAGKNIVSGVVAYPKGLHYEVVFLVSGVEMWKKQSIAKIKKSFGAQYPRIAWLTVIGPDGESLAMVNAMKPMDVTANSGIGPLTGVGPIIRVRHAKAIVETIEVDLLRFVITMQKSSPRIATVVSSPAEIAIVCPGTTVDASVARIDLSYEMTEGLELPR
jgi:hypothetical protein